jgi:hypothetical protein
MNEDNPPMALPNGQVYGKEALLALAAENAGERERERPKTLDPKP